MERIAIVGCGGSGKTTVARRLAALLDLPVIHLDAIYYDEDWNPLPQAAFAAAQAEIVRGDRWIIEGNYAATLPIRLAAADTLIFLDLSTVACLWGIAQRRWRHRGGQHRDTGVFDRVTWQFVRYVAGYRATMRPRIMAARGPRLIRLTSRRAVNRFLRDGMPPAGTGLR